MRRGDIVTVAMQGDSGKPRPALVVQGDAFDALTMVALLPLTSTILPTALTRIDVAPDGQNGLHVPSQVMVHRISSVRREKIGAVIGHLDDVTMLAVSRAMVVFPRAGMTLARPIRACPNETRRGNRKQAVNRPIEVGFGLSDVSSRRILAAIGQIRPWSGQWRGRARGHGPGAWSRSVDRGAPAPARSRGHRDQHPPGGRGLVAPNPAICRFSRTSLGNGLGDEGGCRF